MRTIPLLLVATVLGIVAIGCLTYLIRRDDVVPHRRLGATWVVCATACVVCTVAALTGWPR